MAYINNQSLMNVSICHSKWVKSWLCEKEKHNHTPFEKEQITLLLGTIIVLTSCKPQRERERAHVCARVSEEQELKTVVEVSETNWNGHGQG
jgi:hypothetical protein